MHQGASSWLPSAALSILFATSSPGTSASAREIVAAPGGYSAGTIVIRTSERRLYYYLGNGTAVRYPVGVSRAGMQWADASYIDGKYRHPDWSPPASIRKDYSKLPPVVPGGSPNNPMGVAAMTLHDTEYAIHGTNDPGTIGGFVSHGCIRMYNEDITDLFERANLGAEVVVTH